MHSSYGEGLETDRARRRYRASPLPDRSIIAKRKTPWGSAKPNCGMLHLCPNNPYLRSLPTVLYCSLLSKHLAHSVVPPTPNCLNGAETHADLPVWT